MSPLCTLCRRQAETAGASGHPTEPSLSDGTSCSRCGASARDERHLLAVESGGERPEPGSPTDVLLAGASGCVLAAAVAFVLAFGGVMPSTTGAAGAVLLAAGLVARIGGGRL